MSEMRYVIDKVIPDAALLLPDSMNTKAARAMLVAIGLQESRFEHRRQIGGPARGFWQFEQGGGVRGVLNHPASKSHIRRILDDMGYDERSETSYHALEHNDVLACVYARLLLWTDPRPLPGIGDPDNGWEYYFRNWRPGKPHRQTWDAFYEQAWNAIAA